MNPFETKETNEYEVRFNGFNAINEVMNKINKKKAYDLTKEIEEGIYEKTILNVNERGGYLNWSHNDIHSEYSLLIYSLMCNLDIDGQVENTKPKEILKKNNIDQLLNMDIKELAPSHVWKDAINEITRRQNTTQQKVSGNSKFYCKKCHKKNIVVTTAQLRGADEATNIIITCQDCNFVSIK